MVVLVFHKNDVFTLPHPKIRPRPKNRYRSIALKFYMGKLSTLADTMATLVLRENDVFTLPRPCSPAAQKCIVHRLQGNVTRQSNQRMRICNW